MEVRTRSFGSYEGIQFDEIIIEHEDKFALTFSDLGARINTWSVPNDTGDLESIILGYENANQVFNHPSYYYGATIGRVAGRIADGKFMIDGESYSVSVNNGLNHLHGGLDNMAFQKWHYEIIESANQIAVIFSILDPKGKNGYPGNLAVQVTYTISQEQVLTIDYEAKTDEPTLFNPTNHVYFNLNGHNKENTENHVIEVKADSFLPLKEDSIPTGEIAPVYGTPFDLNNGLEFKEILSSSHEQIQAFSGLDHPFMLNHEGDYVAKISVPKRNRAVYMKTDEPVVVIYSHQDISDPINLWGREVVGYDGLTLEAQKEPNAINEPTFSSVILRPEKPFHSQTSYWLEIEH